MKQTMLAIAITIASTQAFATNFDFTNPYNHVTQPQLASEAKTRSDADKNLQSQIDQKGVDINTQAKRIDQTNTNVSNLNNKVDSYAAHGATAYNEIKGVQNAQQSQLNAVQNAAQQANVKADSAHVRLDSVETNLGNVQTAAQIANDRATSLESRADTSENAIRETNGAVQNVNADLQSSKAAGVAIATGLNDKIDSVASQGATEFTKTNNNVKAVDDKVNTAIGVQTGINANQTTINNSQANTNTQVRGQLSSVQTSAQNAQSTANVALSVGVSNTASIVKNTNDIKANAQGISKNASDIKDVTTRVTSTEQVNTRQEARLDEHGTAINRNTVQLGQHAQVLNEYGTRLDNQDAMNSRFATDLGNVKSQVNGMQSQLNSQGKRIGQVENGLAMVAATAAIQFNTDPEAGFQAGCGVAQIRSNTGSACAVGGAINKNWFVSGYVMQASSTSGVAASATYSFGR